ncbi:hypothetical protein HY478_01220, partial [Candidatus Uhrbacteria bacterium]|nr:hypothetical protein [Candidatus Uhrbacteria bacterium]
MKPSFNLSPRVAAAGVAMLLAAFAAAPAAFAQPSEDIQTARKAVSDGVSGIKGNASELPLTREQRASRTKSLIGSIITLTGTEIDELSAKLAALTL